jgi:NADH:ubiquinone oxidoreductase subunit
MSLGTKLYTWLYGEEVGVDPFGNRYYRLKGGGARTDRKERRWVMYNGTVEASKVPPEWNGWLHHTFDKPPLDGGRPKAPWQKEHLPNLTGTDATYRPPGHVQQGGQRDKATGDYEPWRPN